VRRNRGGGSMVAVVRGFVYVGVSGLYVVIGEGQDGASPPFRRRAAVRAPDALPGRRAAL